ncbi:putative recombination endonuclease VII protein [Rhizobium phage RHph_I1_18]|nr:putative recombination endonuclease VII protein [Rhizobium phage RHph_I1_18]
MKFCKTCQQTKPLSEFYARKRAKDGLQPRCKQCCSGVARTYYTDILRQHDRYDKITQSRKERTNRNRTFRESFLEGKSCIRCENADRRVLQFHHVDESTKSGNLADMWGGYASIQTIEAEIAKCEILCANCHAIETWDRRIEAWDGLEPPISPHARGVD